MNIQTVRFQNTSFITATNPGELEIKYLRNNFGFNQLHLDDYIHRTQTSKIEMTKDYSLIVLDFPTFNQNGIPASNKVGLLGFSPSTFTSALSQFSNGEKRRVLLTSQVDFFIGKDYLVVLCDTRLSPISHIFSLCQKTLRNREEFMGKGPVFLAYRIIDALVDSCFIFVNEIQGTIDKIDKQFENKWARNPLEETSLTRRNIVVFHTIIKPSLSLFRQLGEGKYKELNDTMQPFWGNILDHLQRIWERIEDSRELIEGISESNESLIASKTNEIVMILTIFSAIILPLNLLASIYGMNIKGLPFAEDPSSMFLISVIMITITIAMLISFKLRRWF